MPCCPIIFCARGVDRLQEAGYLPGVEADTAAFCFWSTVHGLVSLIIRKRIPYPQAASRELAYQAMDFFISSIPLTRASGVEKGD